MTYLSRDTILQREDIKTEDVEVPEWGGNRAGPGDVRRREGMLLSPA